MRGPRDALVSRHICKSGTIIIMQFFSAFAALGYSAIVLVVTFVFVAVFVFNALGLARRPLWAKLVFLAVFAALLVPTTIFLADQRGMLMESIKSEGGLKRIEQPDQSAVTD